MTKTSLSWASTVITAVHEDGRRASAQLAPGEREWCYLDARFSPGRFAVASVHLTADENAADRPTSGLNTARGNEPLVDQRPTFAADQMTTAAHHATTAISVGLFHSDDGLGRRRTPLRELA